MAEAADKGLIQQPEALLSQSQEWSERIHPAADGRDVRILLDFGREVLGYHRFVVDAPAGTILDFHNFEFIQPDGRINFAEGMNNCFAMFAEEATRRTRPCAPGFSIQLLTFANDGAGADPLYRRAL